MASAVVALGITKITAWGTCYYCLGVLAGPIGHDTGWSRGFIFLGLTVACSRWVSFRARLVG